MHRYTFDVTPIITQLLNWPFLAFIVVLLFQDELRKLISRIKKAGVFGHELEFNEEVKNFDESVSKAEGSTPEDPLNLFGSSKEKDNTNDYFRDPQLGIMAVSRDIEKEMRLLSGSLGLIRDRKLNGIRQYFEALKSYGALSEDITSALGIFIDLRNKIVHGHDIDNKTYAINVLGIALNLLKTIKLIPRETHIVHISNITIYSDNHCRDARPDVKGLVLKVLDINGNELDHRIYPTTKSGYYQIGEKVSWEWDMSNTWNESWYVDPTTHEKKIAWNSAAEFVGRHLKDIT